MLRPLIRSGFMALALAATVLPLQAATYEVDQSHSETAFQIRHLVTKVRGQFDDFAGTINFDPANLAGSSVDFKIKTASINTSHADRDKHLRAPDFFDVEKYPEITFKSAAFHKEGDTYHVTGNLTMHGVTKEITLPVHFLGEAKDPWGKTRAGFEAEITLDRKDFGISWNKALDQGGTILGDDVRVIINLETIKQP